MENSIEDTVTELVLARVPPETKIVIMAVMGSRGKLMSSEKDNDSDYDVKVVVQYTIKDYLLRNHTSKPIYQYTKCGNYIEDGREFDIAIIDVRKCIEWCLESNQSAEDILFTPFHLIKDVEKVNELKQFYCKHYHGNNVMAALAGQVRSEQHETTKKGTPLNLKRAMNMVYYTMRIEFIKKYQTVPPIDVNSLMEKLNVESWIEELLQLRKQNKNAPFEISMFPQFEEFVNISEDYKKQKLKLSTETLQEADEMFLRYCGYYSTYQRNLT